MKCPECQTNNRVLFGWVDKYPSCFYEILVCHACDISFKGFPLTEDDPAVQAYIEDRKERAEEERMRALRIVRYKESGSTFDMMSDPIALVDGHGKCLAIIDGNPENVIRVGQLFDPGESLKPFGPYPMNAPETFYPKAKTFEEARQMHNKAWLERLLRQYN